MDLSKKLNFAMQARDSGISPDILHLKQGNVVQNAPYTSVDEPFIGESWKEYWQIFTRQDFPKKMSTMW